MAYNYLNNVGLQHLITSIKSLLAGKADSDHTHANAITSAAGFMSASDKTTLDELSSGNLQLQVNDLKDAAAPISQKKTTVYDGNTVTTTFADGRKIVTTYNGDTVIDKMYSSANVLQWTKTTVYNGDTVTETIEEVK